MEENLQPSQKIVKRSGATAKSVSGSLQPEQALQILQQAVKTCQQAGIKADIATTKIRGERSVVVMITGTKIIDGNILPVTEEEE